MNRERRKIYLLQTLRRPPFYFLLPKKSKWEVHPEPPQNHIILDGALSSLPPKENTLYFPLQGPVRTSKNRPKNAYLKPQYCTDPSPLAPLASIVLPPETFNAKKTHPKFVGALSLEIEFFRLSEIESIFDTFRDPTISKLLGSTSKRYLFVNLHFWVVDTKFYGNEWILHFFSSTAGLVQF